MKIIITTTTAESRSRLVSTPVSYSQIPDSDIDLGTAFPGTCVGFFSPYRQSLGW
jgi:hypothetical protein